MILRAGQRRHRPFLRKGIRVTRAMALDGIDGFGDRFGRCQKTEPPASHRPGLGKTMDDNRVLVVSWGKAGHAFMFGSIVEEVLVDLIAHDENTFVHANISERLY